MTSSVKFVNPAVRTIVGNQRLTGSCGDVKIAWDTQAMERQTGDLDEVLW
jgi:hypothetical protein